MERMKNKTSNLENELQILKEQQEENRQVDLPDLPVEPVLPELDQPNPPVLPEPNQARPFHSKTVKSYGQDITVNNIPCDYTLVHRSLFSKLESKAKQLQEFQQRNIHTDKYHGTALGR